MKRLILIDGNSLFHRAYHALPISLTFEGKPVNAVYGFSNMLLKAIGDLKPTHIAIAWDSIAPTFRHVEYEEYKAQRAAPPEDLYPQKVVLEKVLEAFEIPSFELAGFEADDLIATLATQARELVKEKKLDKIMILTGDRDTLQLVSKDINIYSSGQKLTEPIVFDKKKIKEKYGLKPSQMVDFKALAGDPSDNIPGVRGLGPKTAADLLAKYGNLERIYQNLKKLSQALQGKLSQDREKAFQARKLVELDRQVPIILDLKNSQAKFDWQKVQAAFAHLHFKSLIARLPIESKDLENLEEKEPVNVLKDKKSKDQMELV